MGGRAIRGRPAAFAVQRRGGRARPRSRRPSAARSRATVTFSKQLLSADAGLSWKRADCAPPRSARKDTFRRLTFSFLSPVCPSPAPAISLARGHGPGDAPGCVPGRRRLGRGRSKGACFPGALTGRGAALPSLLGQRRKEIGRQRKHVSVPAAVGNRRPRPVLPVLFFFNQTQFHCLNPWVSAASSTHSGAVTPAARQTASGRPGRLRARAAHLACVTAPLDRGQEPGPQSREPATGRTPWSGVLEASCPERSPFCWFWAAVGPRGRPPQQGGN